ncbi:unnamed protein product, partial [Ranitomeya imitator]
GSTSQLETFLNCLNTNPFNIRLTWKYSQSFIDFLDLAISRLPDGTLATDVFRKSTATNALLHFSSSHPPKLKSSIPIGQFLRARRICSDDDTFSRQAGELTRRFRNRGYRHADIQRGYSRALHSDRSSLLAGPTSRPPAKTDSVPRFITQFNSNWSEISEIFKRHWPVLLTDKDLSRQLTPHPLITWRSMSPELKNLRIRLGIKHMIVHHITCNTEAIVYYAQCPCDRIYIGMTTRAFKVRVQEHVRDIRNSATCSEPLLLKSIPRHFFDVHHSDPRGLRFCGIDHVYMGIRGGNTKQKLFQKETRWMVTLGTLSPMGLNEAISFKSFL